MDAIIGWVITRKPVASGTWWGSIAKSIRVWWGTKFQANPASATLDAIHTWPMVLCRGEKKRSPAETLDRRIARSRNAVEGAQANSHRGTAAVDLSSCHAVCPVRSSILISRIWTQTWTGSFRNAIRALAIFCPGHNKAATRKRNLQEGEAQGGAGDRPSAPPTSPRLWVDDGNTFGILKLISFVSQLRGRVADRGIASAHGP